MTGTVLTTQPHASEYRASEYSVSTVLKAEPHARASLGSARRHVCDAPGTTRIDVLAQPPRLLTAARVARVGEPSAAPSGARRRRFSCLTSTELQTLHSVCPPARFRPAACVHAHAPSTAQTAAVVR